MAFRVALTYTGFHVGCPDWHRGLRVVLTLTPVSNRGFLRNVLTYTGIKQGLRVVMTCTKDLLVVLTYTSIKQGFSEKCPDLRQDQRGLSWLTQGIKSCLDLHQCHQGFSEKCPDLCWDQTGFQVCPNLHKGSRVVLTYTSVKRFFSPEKCPDLRRDQTGFQGCPPVQSGFCPWALSWWKSRSCPLLQTWPYGGMTHLPHHHSPGQQSPWVH